jgi:hypothetical protein
MKYKASVPTSQRTPSVYITNTSQLMLYREIIAVFSEIHTKHINTMCGQNEETLNVTADGTNSYHWAHTRPYFTFIINK